MSNSDLFANKLSTLTSNNSTQSNSTLDSLRQTGANKETVQTDNALTQEDFFALLSQQLSMQDPFKPVDNEQMIAQMSSFSTVDGISKLNQEIVSLNAVMTSSQALQASGLVGQKVLIPSNQTKITAEDNTLSGVISSPIAVNEIKVQIEDSAGQVIRSLSLGQSQAGNNEFSWDGKDNSGKAVVEGEYQINAAALIDGEARILPVSTYAHVSSVSLGSNGGEAVLNLRNANSVTLSNVLAVAER